MGKRFVPLMQRHHLETVSRPFVELLFSTPYMAESLVLVATKATLASFNPPLRAAVGDSPHDEPGLG
ncbi:hypothetical protein MY11210_001092 [Beauveria gryllotalpidicola]